MEMETRSKYIYKEQDNESKLADHGVRKYDYDLGRFLSIDKLWEKYYGWTPYQYSMNRIEK
jgi:RHS repeat-associated protein